MLIWHQFGIIPRNSDVPYSPNHFLGWNFFCHFLQQDGSNRHRQQIKLHPLSWQYPLMNYLGTGKTARKKRFFKSLSVSIGKDGENINVSSEKGVAQLVRKNSIMSLGIFAAAMKVAVIYLSFYVTKTVLIGPKWFWSDQIDLDLTIMIWSRPKWNGHDQNKLVRSKCDSFW